MNTQERNKTLLSDEEPDFMESDYDEEFNLHWNTDERPEGFGDRFYEHLERDIDEALDGEDGADFDDYDGLIDDEVEGWDERDE